VKRLRLLTRRANLLESLDKVEHRIQMECRRLGIPRGAATRLARKEKS
jgi:hypothetical protein